MLNRGWTTYYVDLLLLPYFLKFKHLHPKNWYLIRVLTLQKEGSTRALILHLRAQVRGNIRKFINDQTLICGKVLGELNSDLWAKRGKLKELKIRSEKAKDTRKGVVAWRRMVLDLSRTNKVVELPTIPNTQQITADHAAKLELTSSYNGWPATECGGFPQLTIRNGKLFQKSHKEEPFFEGVITDYVNMIAVEREERTA